jgi:hypothetical protein
MKKKRAKVDFIQEQIDKRQEDIWLMEVVRDFNLTKEPSTPVITARGKTTAAIEADAANLRIKEIEMEITFLKSYLAHESNPSKKA